MHGCGLWEETGVSEENPHMHRENFTQKGPRLDSIHQPSYFITAPPVAPLLMLPALIMSFSVAALSGFILSQSYIISANEWNAPLNHFCLVPPVCVQGSESHQDLSASPSKRSLSSSVSQSLNQETGTSDKTLSSKRFFLWLWSVSSSLLPFMSVSRRVFYLFFLPLYCIYLLALGLILVLFFLFSLLLLKPYLCALAPSLVFSGSSPLFFISAFRLCCILSPSSEGCTQAADVFASWWKGGQRADSCPSAGTLSSPVLSKIRISCASLQLQSKYLLL